MMERVKEGIKESGQELEAMARKEKDWRRRIRLQMLALIKEGKATTREEVANRLGIHRNEVLKVFT